MGTGHPLQFPSSGTPLAAAAAPLLMINHFNPLYNKAITTTSPGRPNSTRCRFAGYDGHGGAERFRFNLDREEFVAGDGDDEFSFGGGAKKRVWWSDDTVEMDNEEDEVGFGVLEDYIDPSWIFKVVNAFGWMVPAIAISMLLGTGSNAFFMALVLPIAQSAVSLATEAFWGRSRGRPKPKRRTKAKPFARTASDVGMNKEKEDIGSSKARENYQSWRAGNDSSSKTRDQRRPPSSFGGWDALDEGAGSYNGSPAQKAKETRQQKRSKLSRRVRNRERPLLLRLLVAVFPFLGSWTRLL
ncbi:uncharacterized protein LOC127797552 [Diospyros lotus]|uniref:uncharacterized protein LOC127797552 n=1 Tax=Diospyros lotus TaxID=55363 RepID=UPI00225A28F3|nr:uncharacterized protein LOC127797552 [Diospyros lotus]